MTDPMWWPDPTGRHQFRYWDGTAWTEHVANDGVGGVDPLDAPAAPAYGTTSVPAAEVPRTAGPAAPIPRSVERPGRPRIQPLTLEELASRRIIGAPDPDPTEVMPRRVIAFLIDAAVCFAAVVLLIMAIAPSYSGAGDAYRCEPGSSGSFSEDASCSQPTFVEIGDRNYDVTSGATGFEILGAFVAFTFVYWAVAEAVLGTTLGKALLGLRVVDLQGRRTELGRTSVRWLLLVLDGPLTAFICGLMLSSSTNGHQRLGDRWSDTYVVHRSDTGKPLTLPE